ncbi:MAG: hypothetical protein LUF92_00290 [Clostridiales bacterium]|nr:hypothetical protein [Clostridiales bacterium]
MLDKSTVGEKTALQLEEDAVLHIEYCARTLYIGRTGKCGTVFEKSEYKVD